MRKKKNTKKQEQNKNSNKKRIRNKSKEDPLGSYTGVPMDGGKPVQDVDDL